MKNVCTKIFLTIAILGASIPIIYLLAGFLIIIHSEQGVSEILKTSSNSELISAIAGIFSAIAAFMSWLASSKAAEAAEKSNIIASLADRTKTRDALSSIWRYFNDKSCVLSYDSRNPQQFLVTKEEIELIEKQKETIFCNSAAYGEVFQNKVISFYAYMISEIKAQQILCDFENGEETLLTDTQKKYHSFRIGERDKYFDLLQEAVRLMHRQP